MTAGHLVYRLLFKWNKTNDFGISIRLLKEVEAFICLLAKECYKRLQVPVWILLEDMILIKPYKQNKSMTFCFISWALYILSSREVCLYVNKCELYRVYFLITFQVFRLKQPMSSLFLFILGKPLILSLKLKFIKKKNYYIKLWL